MSLLLRRHRRKQEDEAVEESVETEEVEATEDEVVDYEELTVPQLKELADEREFEYKSNVTKPELIELLK